MSDTEKILKLIEELDIEELKLLKDKIDKKLHKIYQYIPSNDSEVIAGYARNFHYSEERREEVLKKIKSLGEK
ncbi:MAG: hypothetical protein IJ068_03625 [Bacilli bacterium]|nr:hypothetical protein [Bacilli bacterium]